LYSSKKKNYQQRFETCWLFNKRETQTEQYFKNYILILFCLYMRFFAFIFLSLLFPLVLFAQEATSSAGGNISGKGGSVSYTLGQVSYTSISLSDIIFGEGVQQAFDKTSGIIIPGETSSSDLTIDCVVFPNPTTNYVTLTVKNSNYNDLKYLLYDSSKKLITQNDIQTANTIVSLVDLPTGTYLLTVMNPKKNILRIFKIIKDYIQQ